MDLLEVVRSEWQKAKNMLDQQMGVMNPQAYAAYYAAYGATAGPAPPQPSGEAPPPPSEAPPPPPPDGQYAIRILAPFPC